jgi:glycogen operon protein
VGHERERLSLNQMIREANKTWHGMKLDQPDWGAWSHSFAFGVVLEKDGVLAHFILNAHSEPLDFELPSVGGQDPSPWRRWIDTSLDSPHDIVQWEEAAVVSGHTYRVESRSVVVLHAALV